MSRIKISFAVCLSALGLSAVWAPDGDAFSVSVNYSDALLTQGAHLNDKGDHDGAIALFTQAIDQKTPDLWQAFYLRGVAYGQKGHFDRAIADYSRWIEARPNEAEALALRGLSYSREGREKDAVADFEKALQLDPGNVLALAWRGGSFLRLGKFKEAAADFSRWMELQPKEPLACLMRAQAYLAQGRGQEALEDCNKASALRLDPNDVFALRTRAEILVNLGKFEDALHDYERLLTSRPQDSLSRFNEGVAYYRLGRTEEARDVAQGVVESGDKMEAEFSGDHLLAMFELDKRRADAKAALEKARTADKIGNPAAAFRNFQKAYAQAVGIPGNELYRGQMLVDGLAVDPISDDHTVLEESRDGLKRAYPKLNAKPALPESARRYLVQAKVLIKEQNDSDPAAYSKVPASYAKVEGIAPWFPDAY